MNLTYDQTSSLFNLINFDLWKVDPSNQCMSLTGKLKNQQIILQIKPSILNSILLTNLDKFRDLQLKQPISYLILHIRAGKGGLALFSNSSLVKHKIIKKYMVRKKQGKAQHTYNILKGKARGGAKLRLERTKEFYQEISEKLNNWKVDINQIEFIFYQCTPRLWEGLFKAKNNLPFLKNDPRLYKIPLTTYQPSLKEINRINFHIYHSILRIQPKNVFKMEFETLMRNLAILEVSQTVASA